MIRAFLRSAIHNAIVTETDSAWPVSVRLDPVLLRAADILPLERVEVVNLATGEHIAAWVEAAPEGKGTVRVHAGSRVSIRSGDVISILCFGFPHDGQALTHVAKVVTVGEGNRVLSVGEADTKG